MGPGFKTKRNKSHIEAPIIRLGHANVAAHRPLSNAFIAICIFSYLIWFCLEPRTAFKSLFATMAWVSVFFAAVRLIALCSNKPQDHGVAELSDDLPIYTVLVPLFHEVQMVDQIMRGLDELRYPKDKLDIILITEAVDPLTTQAVAKAIRPPFRQIVVPKGTPQTKPRALNTALRTSQGQFVTIYDAEDRPHPDQLLAALAAFDARPDWAAVQAPLEYYNHDDNWLTRQFALEYAALFHVWVPFLAKLGLPFPLGGTSNHMRGLM
jgi:cellulose synthase/poly-beta-1,6-N-acetylglucosamine synthase-like glycosyltransferase